MKIWRNSNDAWKEVLPGVFSRVLSEAEFCTLSTVLFKQGATYPLHKAKEKHFGMLTKGAGTFDTGKEKVNFREGDAFFIEPGEDHGFTNVSNGDSIVLEAFAPSKKEHLAQTQRPQIGY